jgi:hypothetical protein
MAVIVCGVLLLPLCAVPLYAAGSYVARGADTDPSNGVFQLGLILGVGIPAITAISLGRLSAAWKWPPALALGVVTGFLSVVTLIATLVIFFSDAIS